MPDASEPQADPGDPGAAIERYRDLAKYLITVFAAVGGLLVAGTQLASIGKLSWDDHPGRVIATVLGLAVAIAAVARVIWLVLRVLRPIELSLEAIEADAGLSAYLQARPSLLGGLPTVQALREQVSSPVLDDDERAAWAKIADRAVGAAAYHRMQSSFEGTWRPLLAAAFVGAAGIVAFTWGANPPAASATSDPIVRPAPALVSFTLTADGRDTLGSALGEGCARGAVRALVIGGSETAPLVVTLPERGCQAAQFVLQPQWGAAIAVK
jgi:hypothetical protein